MENEDSFFIARVNVEIVLKLACEEYKATSPSPAECFPASDALNFATITAL